MGRGLSGCYAAMPATEPEKADAKSKDGSSWGGRSKLLAGITYLYTPALRGHGEFLISISVRAQTCQNPGRMRLPVTS